MTNDDVGMQMQLALATTQQHSLQLSFSHPWLANVLGILSARWQGPVYGLFHGICLLTSAGIIFFLACKKSCSHPSIRIVTALILIFFFSVLFHQWQFTISAGLLSIAAACCILECLEKEPNEIPTSPWLWCGVGLYVLALLIRPPMAKLQLAIPIALCTVECGKSLFQSTRHTWKSAVWTASILLLLLFLLPRVISSKGQGAAFDSFNSARASFVDHHWRDYSDSDRMAEVISTVGWTDNDLFLAKNWFFIDPEVFTEPAFRAVAGAARPASLDGNSFEHVVGGGWRELCRKQKEDPVIGMLAACLLPMLCVWILGPHRLLWILVSFSGFLGLYAWVLFRFGNIPDRVLFPLALSILVLPWMRREDPWRTPGILRRLRWMVPLALIICISLPSLYASLLQVRYRMEFLRTQTTEWQNSLSWAGTRSTPLIDWGGVPWTGIRPLDSLPQSASSSFLQLGVGQQKTVWPTLVRALDDPRVWPSLPDSGVIWILPDNILAAYRSEALCRFLSERYGQQVRPVSIPIPQDLPFVAITVVSLESPK